MPNYLMWRDHGEVMPAATLESDRNEDEDQMDDMIADILTKDNPGSGE
jgi:hypothetical protein